MCVFKIAFFIKVKYFRKFGKYRKKYKGDILVLSEKKL